MTEYVQADILSLFEQKLKGKSLSDYFYFLFQINMLGKTANIEKVQFLPALV